jgi:hypothetical protein
LGEQQSTSEEKDTRGKACAQQERLTTARNSECLRDPVGPENVHSIFSPTGRAWNLAARPVSTHRRAGKEREAVGDPHVRLVWHLRHEAIFFLE